MISNDEVGNVRYEDEAKTNQDTVVMNDDDDQQCVQGDKCDVTVTPPMSS